MNIIQDGLYTVDNPSLLNKSKKVVKMAIKGTAYTAFLAIAVASALHLYSNPDDRASVSEGLKSTGLAVKAKVNSSYFHLTGSSLSEHVTKTEDVAVHATKDMVKAVKAVEDNAPTKEDGKKMVHGTKVAGTMLSSEIKKHAPGIADTVKKDTEKSTEEAKDSIKKHIKQIRQYSGDLTQRIADSIKP